MTPKQWLCCQVLAMSTGLVVAMVLGSGIQIMTIWALSYLTSAVAFQFVLAVFDKGVLAHAPQRPAGSRARSD
jgi:hypothetical protein